MLSLPAVVTLWDRIDKSLHRVRENIAAACARSGRSQREVSIVAVTKSATLEATATAVELGLTDLGESRIQQLLERAAALEGALRKRRNAKAPVRWHMIGHLQRNKVRATLEVVEAIHSVDSLRLAEAIDQRAEERGKVVDVLIQVNCSQEPQKFGVAVGAAAYLGELVSTLKHLRLVGLMTMAPRVDNPEKARPSFLRLRELFEEMRKDGIGGSDFRHLSMGMSQDYAVAVEEGATILRIGTALFGR
ncbi:MAG: YggS family pyridoxal phosphate-dependent enzyme [Phycisphaerae bacterium]|jgi:pyridoxal phosphate enzyme (YggS family)